MVRNEKIENYSDDLIIALFRDAELKYQKDAFLLKDEKEFQKIKNGEIKILDKIKEKIKDIFEIYPQEQPELVFGAKRDISQIFLNKFFKKKNIFKADKITLSANIIDDKVEIVIKQGFELLPENIEITRNNEKIKIDVKTVDNKISINFPYIQGSYEMKLKYLEEKILIFQIYVY